MDNLECPICLDISENAVECSQCAQIFCEKCTIGLKKCAMCRNESGFKTSNFARKLINNLPAECDQCNTKLTRIELKSHICPNRIIKCGFCDYSGNKKEIITHTGNKHIDNIIDTFSNAPLNKKDVLVLWENKTTVLIQPIDKLITRTGLMQYNKITIKAKITTTNPSYVVFGLSDRKLLLAKGYLGGDMGKGTWGIAGNGSLGEEGKWVTGMKFTNGSIIEINFDNGLITFSVNGQLANYKYKFSSPKVFIACSMFYAGDRVDIL
jgi:hypothetical protein